MKTVYVILVTHIDQFVTHTGHSDPKVSQKGYDSFDKAAEFVKKRVNGSRHGWYENNHTCVDCDNDISYTIVEVRVA